MVILQVAFNVCAVLLQIRRSILVTKNSFKSSNYAIFLSCPAATFVVFLYIITLCTWANLKFKKKMYSKDAVKLAYPRMKSHLLGSRGYRCS